MPGRNVVLATGEIYHLYNRGVAGQPTFTDKRDYLKFIETLIYYQNKNIPLRFSKYLTLAHIDREQIMNQLKKEKDLLVEILGFCLMPNHFHLIIKQMDDAGIAKFTGQLENSYTRYFNVKNKRQGHLFQGKFKAKRIETEEQFLHVLRYVHLNPYSGYVVKKVENVFNYPYSSMAEYTERQNRIVNQDMIWHYFRKPELFREFTSDQADYQRKLEEIKHLLME